MDRKGIIAIILSIALLFVWQMQNQKYMDAMARSRQAQSAGNTANATPDAQASAQASAQANPQASAAPTATPATPEAAVPVQSESLSNSVAEYTFSNRGGGITGVALRSHQGAQPGESLRLNRNGNAPLGALLLRPEDPTLPVYQSRVEGRTVTFDRTQSDGIRITKSFTVPETRGDGKKFRSSDEYTVALEVAFTNTSAAPVDLPAWYLSAGSAEPIHASEMPMYTGLDWDRDGKATYIDVNWFESRHILGMETSAAKSAYVESPGGIVWAGVKNQYYTTILTPETPAKGVWANRLALTLEDKPVKGIQAALEFPGFKLAPGETVRRKFTLYSGPKEYRRLAALGHGETAMMNFGIFKLISIFLLKVMNRIYDLIGSYAWAIIILTFVVRGALWPIQGAATKSMKRMALLNPKITELREKYKDDPAKMNAEMMQLYKDYGVNPFAGCLPMFIQIPIFFGFYSMLGTAVELRNSSFLWVHDLSRPDTILHLGGLPLNILPLLMAGTMLWQMSLTPKSGDPAQQKIFMFMPLIFIWFTYNFASALALYYTIQNVLSIFQLYVTRNQTGPTLDKVIPPSKGGGRRR
jgi:YidC/Oxa1 family membrane protein insertase